MGSYHWPRLRNGLRGWSSSWRLLERRLPANGVNKKSNPLASGSVEGCSSGRAWGQGSTALVHAGPTASSLAVSDRALAGVGLAWQSLLMTATAEACCEVRIEGAWQLVPLSEVHALHRDADKRCPTCHGVVRTQATYSGRRLISMVHWRAHDGCPRMPRQYAGTQKLHPEPLP